MKLLHWQYHPHHHVLICTSIHDCQDHWKQGATLDQLGPKTKELTSLCMVEVGFPFAVSTLHDQGIQNIHQFLLVTFLVLHTAKLPTHPMEVSWYACAPFQQPHDVVSSFDSPPPLIVVKSQCSLASTNQVFPIESQILILASTHVHHFHPDVHIHDLC